MSIKISDHFTFGRLIRFCLPSMVMMVFMSIYGVVDGLFVSNFAGKTSFAAINLILPFSMMMGSIGFMIGTGGSALVAKTLGEGDRNTADRFFSMMVKLTAMCGITLSVIGFLLVPKAAVILGATEDMLGDCVLYARTLMIFNTAFMLQNVFQSFFVTAEKPKLGLAFTVAAGVTNMVLDALFIGVFGWGVVGAAAATGISQTVGGILPIIYFISKKNSSLLHLRSVKLEMRPIANTCLNGSSELMTNISVSLVSMLYNLRLMEYAGENGVAAYGVLMYVQFIFIGFFIGYCIGMAPVVGYNYGAQNRPELKNVLKKSLIFMGGSGIVMMCIARLAASPTAKLFVGYDAELFELTRHAFSLFSFSFLLAGLNIFLSAFFTALNNGPVSALISFMRTLVFQALCVIVLPMILDIDGIWLAMTFAEVFAFLFAAILLLANRKKYGYL